MKGNYNNIAPYYDRLSRIIFGHAIVNAHRWLAQFITTNTSILIAGGGTGWILEEIAKRHPEGLCITYVDISEKMIALSKKKQVGKNQVVFINEPIQNVTFHQQFDVVMTPFVLDNFSEDTTLRIFRKIDEHLIPGGLWLFTDFQLAGKHQLWQKPLLKMMYFFFRVVCGIEAKQLPGTNTLFNQYNYKQISAKTFFSNFICALVFKK